jgi:hypothetical protein
VESPAAKRYDVLEVHGSPYDRGFAYGEYHRERLRRHLQSHYSFYAMYLGTSRDEAIREASRYAEPTKDYSQTVWSELNGTADGAAIPLDEVMLITAFNEVFYPKFEKLCTSFAVRGKATADGLTYVGQNNDEGVDPWMNGDCSTLTRHVQSDAPNALIYTYVGAPAMMGINSRGLSICINALACESPRAGVPLLAVVREALNQRDLDGALREIERAKRAYALNFMLGTHEGVFDVEAYPDRVLTLRADSMLWHTNHCLYSKGLKYESEDSYTNSTTRCSRIETLLNSNRGKLDLKMLEGFMADHENGANSICLHVNQAKPLPKREKTLDSMIFIPERKEAWIAKGNPCETEFVRYEV